VKLESVAITHYVEHGGLHYRTIDGKNWEIALGESWEPAFHEQDALTKLFAGLDLPIRSPYKWNDVLEALEKAYQEWAKLDTLSGESAELARSTPVRFPTEHFTELMQAYDDWLD
jgi:hypothetical protein